MGYMGMMRFRVEGFGMLVSCGGRVMKNHMDQQSEHELETGL